MLCISAACCRAVSVRLLPGSFPHRGGLIPPTFAQHPPASGRKEGERGREGRGKGKRRGEGKGRDPQGLVDTPMFQILKNTLSVTRSFKTNYCVETLCRVASRVAVPAGVSQTHRCFTHPHPTVKFMLACHKRATFGLNLFHVVV